MRSINGVNVCDQSEPIELPEEFPSIPPSDDQARFGYRLVEEEGVKKWVYASAEDFREIHALLGIPVRDIDMEIEKRKSQAKVGCGFNANHQCVGDCQMFHSVCRGVCKPGHPETIVSCSCLGAGF